MPGLGNARRRAGAGLWANETLTACPTTALKLRKPEQYR